MGSTVQLKCLSPDPASRGERDTPPHVPHSSALRFSRLRGARAPELNLCPFDSFMFATALELYCRALQEDSNVCCLRRQSLSSTSATYRRNQNLIRWKNQRWVQRIPKTPQFQVDWQSISTAQV